MSRYSVGVILEFLLEPCSHSADAVDVQDVATLLYVAATRRVFPEIMPAHRKSGDLASCLQKFGLTQPKIEPILPSEMALLSFTQALLRRRFH